MLLKLIEPIDRIIDRISMYRLLIYYLVGLLLVAIVLSIFHILHFNPFYILISAVVLVLTCWIVNRILAKIFQAPINPESAILTGLILSLIIAPKPTGFSFLFLLAVSGLAMASKYILTINRKHVFNPAAIAVVLTALGPKQSADWWVGTASMLPFVIIGGVLLVRKIRRGQMVLVFLIATTIATVLLPSGGAPVFEALKNMVLNSSAFFLGFVMLTEPYTSPATKNKQIIYAIIVGVILAPQFHIGSYYSTPEVALIIGNLYAYISGSKIKLFPTLARKYKVASDTAEFEFVPDQAIDYKPGQYMEFTLPHEAADNRGVRRYFTLSSSPTEDKIKIGVKFYEVSSTYKSALIDINQSTPIVASQLAGDFVLPNNHQQKLLFIAGGIGITPFRSMIKYLIDNNEQRDIVLLYSASSVKQLAYLKDLEESRNKLGIKIYYVISKDDGNLPDEDYFIAGRINNQLIRSLVPDCDQRMIYISGTHPMVESLQESLPHIGVKFRNIKVDYFPGYI